MPAGGGALALAVILYSGDRVVFYCPWESIPYRFRDPEERLLSLYRSAPDGAKISGVVRPRDREGRYFTLSDAYFIGTRLRDHFDLFALANMRVVEIDFVKR